MSPSFFTTEDNHWFIPTEHTRGPWHKDHCHAGPPTGLVARALELAVPEKRLCRLTVELMRPVPHAGFRIETEIKRNGRSVCVSRASVFDADDRECVSASALHMAPQPDHSYPRPSTASEIDFGQPEDAKVGGFPISRTLHGLPAFNGDGVETRYPAGESPDVGPTTVWMRTVPLLEDETPSPFQRICPLADCGNAFSRNAEPWDISFINPDLTINLHRDPEGEWLGSRSVGHWQSNGHGLADAILFDHLGACGRATQSLLLTPQT